MGNTSVSQRDLIICDLDNTLYDWVGYFVPSFYSMVDVAAETLNCNKELLLDQLRTVHQKHHDSEHPFALFETAIVRSLIEKGTTPERVMTILDPAFHAFNSSRIERLRLYPTVYETLQNLVGKGFTLIAHTESKYFAAVDRLDRLKIYDFFTRIYCRERSVPDFDVPMPVKKPERFTNGKVVELTNHQRKPSPDVLAEICSRENGDLATAVYIGDSFVRDVFMAKATGVRAVWAKYGTNHQAGIYEQLVRVTHWSHDDVERELKLKQLAAQQSPDFICQKSFGEILTYLSQVSPRLK